MKHIVTAALPYANGSLHIGHMVEYLQTDIYVRFLRSVGDEPIFCCADDTHGTPIEMSALKQGITPEELIAKYYKEHKKDFDDFGVSFDSYYNTNSPENKHFSDLIFNRLKEKGLIYQKEVELIYCEHDKRFLPDRYVKGKCPKCKVEDQYGDVCEACGSTHEPTELIDPKCGICGNPPVKRKSTHYYFKLSALSDRLEKWLKENNELQDEIKNYVLNWIKDGLKDWCVSRNAPYFGFKIPGEEDKYYYVWLDAPIGYISSLANYYKSKEKATEYWNNNRLTHFIGKDIIYFHFLFWPAMLMAADFKLPDNLVVHGFLTINKEKMSKSRGTFITAREYLDSLDPEYLRYYFASNLSHTMVDVDLSMTDFKDKINNELVATISNFVNRCVSFADTKLEGKLGKIEHDKIIDDVGSKFKAIEDSYKSFECKEVVNEMLRIGALGNKYFQDKEPWKLVKEDKEAARRVVTNCVNIAKNIGILMQPIMPRFSKKLFEQLNLSDLKWEDLDFSLENHKIGKSGILVEKIEDSIELAQKSATPVKEVECSVSQDVKDLGLKVRTVLINGVRVKKKHEGIERLKRESQKNIAKYESKKILNEYANIDRKGGVDPQTHPNSVQNLFTLIKEKGKLPQINTVVDVYNVVSVESCVSMATHDVSHLDGNIEVRLSSENEEFKSIEGITEKLKAGEVVYADDTKVLGRFSKQCKQTATTHDSQNVVLVAFGNKEVSDKQMDEAIDRACKLITDFNGGNYKILEGAFPLQMKVGKVIEVKGHPKADKLYVMQVDLDKEKRQLVAGIKEHYKPEELMNKNIVILTNLESATIRGVKGEGMLLAAEDKKGKRRVLLAEKSNPGDQVYVEGVTPKDVQISFGDFKKVDMQTDDTGGVVCNGKKLKTDVEEIKVKDIGAGVKVR